MIGMKVYKLLYSKGVTPNQYFLLLSKQQKFSYPKYLNEYSEFISLQEKNYVKRVSDDPESEEYLKFIITNDGYELLEKVNELFNETKVVRKSKYDEWLPYIEKYRLLFPTGKQGSKPIRSNVRELYDRFIWFFENYPNITWENVLETTAKYIEFINSDPSVTPYIKTSSYFIWKEKDKKSRESLLADWCDLVKENKNKPAPDMSKFYKML